VIIIRERKETLNEELLPATKDQMKLLKKQIDSDPELAKMLNSAMSDIPQYKWVFHSERQLPLLRDSSLYDALLFLSIYPKIKLYLSKAGSKFTGFLAYKDTGTEILSMKTASFKDDKRNSNPVLANDLLNFLKAMLPKRSKIEWLAEVPNKTALAQYDKLLNNSNYLWTKELNKNKTMWVYTVIGKN